VKELNALLNKGGISHEIPILSALPTSGDIGGSASPVRITVERFGSDRLSDALFQDYAVACGKAIKTAFRLPGLFFGESESNYATAYASYVVAEAQVFKPERDEFDSLFTLRLLPLLPEGEKFELRTNPVTVHDATVQLQALGLISAAITPQELVRQVNTVSGLDAVPRPEPEVGANPLEALLGGLGARPGQPGQPGQPGGAPGQKLPPGAQPKPQQNFGAGPPRVPSPNSRTKRDSARLVTLADSAAESIERIKDDPTGFMDIAKAVESLPEDDRNVFNALLAARVFSSPHAGDPAAMELVGCSMALLAANLRERGVVS
jgi:hypothetical protein